MEASEYHERLRRFEAYSKGLTGHLAGFSRQAEASLAALRRIGGFRLPPAQIAKGFAELQKAADELRPLIQEAAPALRAIGERIFDLERELTRLSER